MAGTSKDRWGNLIVPQRVQHMGHWLMHYVIHDTDEPVFRNKYFEFAGRYENGYAPIGVGKRITHIDRNGKIAHSYLFTDAGRINAAGAVNVILVPRGTWRRFHIPSGEFLD